jgi:hypothetical protein
VPIGAVLLLLLAGLLYLGIIGTLGYRFSPDEYAGGESRVAEGLSELYLIVVTVLLWIVFAVLLLVGAIKGEMPGWAATLAVVLLPLSGIAVFFATKLYWYYAGWVIVVPVLLPPLIAFYAIWARLPQLHAVLPANIISAATWGAVLVLTIAPVPLSSVDTRAFDARREEQLKASAAQSAQEAAAKNQREIAGFERLNPDSSLRDYLDYIDVQNREHSPRYAQALAGARQVKSRQADAVILLKEGKLRQLEELWQLDVDATPALCEAFDEALREEASRLNLSSSDDNAAKLKDELMRQLPNIKWLVSAHCELGETMARIEKTVRLIWGVATAFPATDVSEALAFADTLAALRQPH